MNLTRRSFFGALLGGVAAASVLDPEKLLWTRTKTIFIPKLAPYSTDLEWDTVEEALKPDRGELCVVILHPSGTAEFLRIEEY